MLVRVEKVQITSKFEKDPDMEDHIEQYTKDLNVKLDRVIAYTEVDLEGRF